MALTKQASSVLKRVAVDFPVLPRLPKLTISADAQAMAAFQTQFDSFYAGLRTAILDKLNALNTPTTVTATPTVSGEQQASLAAIRAQLLSLASQISALTVSTVAPPMSPGDWLKLFDHLGFHTNVIPAADEVTIPADRNLVMYGPLDVDGVLIVDGHFANLSN